MYIYMNAFSRYFYPRRLTVQCKGCKSRGGRKANFGELLGRAKAGMLNPAIFKPEIRSFGLKLVSYPNYLKGMQYLKMVPKNVANINININIDIYLKCG